MQNMNEIESGNDEQQEETPINELEKLDEKLRSRYLEGNRQLLLWKAYFPKISYPLKLEIEFLKLFPTETLRDECMNLNDIVQQQRKLVNSVFSYLHLLESKRYRLIVENIVFYNSLYCEHGTNITMSFFYAFVARLHKVVKKQYLDIQSCLILLSWICCLIEAGISALLQDELVKEQAEKCFLILFDDIYCICNVVGHDSKYGKHQFSRISNGFVKFPDLFVRFTEILFNPQYTISIKHSDIINLLLLHSQQNSLLKSRLKEQFLDLFLVVMKQICSSKELSINDEKHSVCAFIPLIKLINHQEFSERFLPELIRSLKRCPEYTLPFLEMFIGESTIDYSNYAGTELLTVLLDSLKSTKEIIRQYSKNVLLNLVRFTSDALVMQKICSEFWNSFGPLLSSISFPEQRRDIIQTINVISNGPSVVDSIVEFCTDRYVAFLQKEGNELVRKTALEGLGLWILRSSKIPVKIMSYYSNGLNGPEKLKHGIIDSLIIAMGNFGSSEKLGQMQSFLDKLIDIVKTYSSKRGSYLLIINNLRLLLSYASNELSVDDKLREEFIYDLILKDNFEPLLPSFSSRLKLDVTNQTNLVYCFEKVLQLCFDLVQSPESPHELFLSVVELLDSQFYEVRRVMSVTLDRIFRSGSNLAPFLLPSLERYISKRPAEASIVRADTVLKCAGKNVPSGSLPLAFLLSFHPELSLFSKRPPYSSFAWKKMLAASNGKQIYSQIESIVQLLLSERALMATDSVVFETGLRATKHMGFCSAEFVEKIFVSLMPLLNSNNLRKLSDKDVAIFYGPEGQLITDVKVNSGFQDDGKLVQTKEKKKRGECRMYSVEDEEWDAQIRQEIEGKKTAQQQQELFMKAKEEEISHQKEFRQSILLSIQPFQRLMAIFRTLAEANPSESRKFIPSLLRALLPFLSYPLLTEDAFETVKIFSSCLLSLKSMSSLVSSVIIFLFSNEMNDRSVLIHLLRKFFKVLTQTCPLTMDSISFSFIFPLLRSLLLDIISSDIQENAMRIVEANIQATMADLPRAEIIDCLIKFMIAYPLFETRCHAAVISVASNVKEDEITPLLDGLLFAQSAVRYSSLAALQRISWLWSGPPPSNIDEIVTLLIICCFDENEHIKNIAPLRQYSIFGKLKSPSLITRFEFEVGRNFGRGIFS